MTEERTHRIKRMTMRAWRRGMKEMDLVLGPFADARLSAMSGDALDLFDALLGENDQDIFPWVTGALPVPDVYAALVAEITDYAKTRHDSGHLKKIISA